MQQSVVDGQTGWLCEARSAGSLSATMLHVLQLSNDELGQFGLRARKRVEELFSEELVISPYLECL